MVDKYGLLGKGLFPETLPPCFDGADLKRALRGILPRIRAKRLNRRSSELIPYNGTKHDGSRRWFATPNPIQYFHVCEFVAEHWVGIDAKISDSPFVVSKPRPASKNADRPIIIPSLSNLTTEASEKLKYSPIIVRADISQFFPSVYTHALPWVAHGRDIAKTDQNPDSSKVYFNALDFYIQRCQSSETRGVAVGPDAFRIIAELIASEIDRKLVEKCKNLIIGGARHVDDFFIGVRDATDAQIVLSSLREVLSDFHFRLNDNKTKITSGLVPLNDTWAQELRKEVRDVNVWAVNRDDLIRVINKSTDISNAINSDSPIKICLRSLDDKKIYSRNENWKFVEPYLQRICFHHSHCIDYVFLLVVKRFASGGEWDATGWSEVAKEIIARNIPLGHDHEVVWATWFLISLGVAIEEETMRKLIDFNNVYINCMIISAYSEGRLTDKPKISFGSKVQSDGPRWLEGLVAISTGYSRAGVSGSFSEEFLHFKTKKLKLIDWDAHIKKVKVLSNSAISHSRYGYDGDDGENEEVEEYDFAF